MILQYTFTACIQAAQLESYSDLAILRTTTFHDYKAFNWLWLTWIASIHKVWSHVYRLMQLRRVQSTLCTCAVCVAAPWGVVARGGRLCGAFSGSGGGRFAAQAVRMVMSSTSFSLAFPTGFSNRGPQRMLMPYEIHGNFGLMSHQS